MIYVAFLKDKCNWLHFLSTSFSFTFRGVSSLLRSPIILTWIWVTATVCVCCRRSRSQSLTVGALWITFCWSLLNRWTSEPYPLFLHRYVKQQQEERQKQYLDKVKELEENKVEGTCLPSARYLAMQHPGSNIPPLFLFLFSLSWERKQ